MFKNINNLFSGKVLLTLPATFILVVFFVVPVFMSLQISLTDFKGVGDANYIGLENYERIFSRSRYAEAVTISLKFCLIVVLVQNLLGLAFATFLHRLPAIRNFCRAALFTPAMMSFVIVGYVWKFIYSPYNGGLNALLSMIGLDSLKLGWLNDPDIALYSVAAAHIWMFVGYSCAIFLAGYANIPSDISEAGELDGASEFNKFRFLELPLLKSSIVINVVFSTIGTLKTFELPFIMTGGGPSGATRMMSLEIINNLFGNYKFGFASALSIIMLATTMLIIYLISRYLRIKEV